MRRWCVCIRALIAALVVGGAALQPDRAREDAGGSREAVADLDERLGALDPADPGAYFRLGEEVGAEGGTELARELFALTLSIALETGDSALGAGACVALADLAETDRDRRWLLAVARGMDDRFASPGWREPASTLLGDVGERAGEAFGAVRAGDGYEARRRLDEPEVAAAIERVVGDEWLDRLSAQADAWPCEECRNRRFVPADDTPSGVRLCPVCGGNPGPPLNRGQLLEHLNAEAALLGIGGGSWAALLVTDGGAPLRDPDPTEVAPRLGVDPGARHWRDGGWSRTPAEGP